MLTSQKVSQPLGKTDLYISGHHLDATVNRLLDPKQFSSISAQDTQAQQQQPHAKNDANNKEAKRLLAQSSMNLMMSPNR